MENCEITFADLTSAILEVHSYFAKRGVVVKVKKKAQQHFTTGHAFPIMIKNAEPHCLDRKRSPRGLNEGN